MKFFKDLLETYKAHESTIKFVGFIIALVMLGVTWREKISPWLKGKTTEAKQEQASGTSNNANPKSVENSKASAQLPGSTIQTNNDSSNHKKAVVANNEARNGGVIDDIHLSNGDFTNNAVSGEGSKIENIYVGDGRFSDNKVSGKGSKISNIYMDNSKTDVTIIPKLNPTNKSQLLSIINALLKTNGKDKSCPIAVFVTGEKLFSFGKETLDFLSSEGYKIITDIGINKHSPEVPAEIVFFKNMIYINLGGI